MGDVVADLIGASPGDPQEDVVHPQILVRLGDDEDGSVRHDDALATRECEVRDGRWECKLRRRPGTVSLHTEVAHIHSPRSAITTDRDAAAQPAPVLRSQVEDKGASPAAECRMKWGDGALADLQHRAERDMLQQYGTLPNACCNAGERCRMHAATPWNAAACHRAFGCGMHADST